MPPRCPSPVRVLALVLLLPIAAPMSGCGASGGEAVQTETAKEHMKTMKQDYGKQTADRYRNQGAAKKAGP
jgi:hypothetical protein